MHKDETKARTLDRDDGQIAYEILGEGPLVVCVPGMGELRSSYRHTMRPLGEAGLRVAAMDLRGHGGSSTTFASYDDVAAATDAIALVEELGGPAVLVGSSMGAGAAVWAAAERPDLVAGLVLLGPFRARRADQPAEGLGLQARHVRFLGAHGLAPAPADALSPAQASGLR